jgi:hypothetical protein
MYSALGGTSTSSPFSATRQEFQMWLLEQIPHIFSVRLFAFSTGNPSIILSIPLWLTPIVISASLTNSSSTNNLTLYGSNAAECIVPKGTSVSITLLST